MDHFLRDIRLGLRTLQKSPGLTLVSVIALMFGIGLTTMMFSIICGAMLRGLPYPDGDKILLVYRANPTQSIEQQSLPIQDFADYRVQQTSFESLHAFTGGTMNVSGAERAERYAGTWISAGLFSMTGIQPILGRDFLERESTPGRSGRGADQRQRHDPLPRGARHLPHRTGRDAQTARAHRSPGPFFRLIAGVFLSQEWRLCLPARSSSR